MGVRARACIRGHDPAVGHNTQGYCRACQRESARASYAKNAEAIRARARAYYHANLEEQRRAHREFMRRYRSTEEGRLATQQSRRKHAQSEKGRAWQRAYNASERGKEASRRYSKSGKRKAAVRRYLASDKGKATTQKHRILRSLHPVKGPLDRAKAQEYRSTDAYRNRHREDMARRRAEARAALPRVSNIDYAMRILAAMRRAE